MSKHYSRWFERLKYQHGYCLMQLFHLWRSIDVHFSVMGVPSWTQSLTSAGLYFSYQYFSVSHTLAGNENSDYTNWGSGSLSSSNNAEANHYTAIDQGTTSGDLTSSADSNTAAGYRVVYRSQVSFLSPCYTSRAHFSASKIMASIRLGAMMSPTLWTRWSSFALWYK